MDNSLTRLQKSTKGCYIGLHFNEAFRYADDIALLSPSNQGLRDMLQICETYVLAYRLSFNAEKSQFIVFRRKQKIILCGSEIYE